MFTIIGGDGKEYGPVSADQIRGWIAAGRANLDTKAKAVGTEDWRRLAEFPDFSAGGPPPVSGFPTAVPASGAVPQTVALDPNLAHRGRRLAARLVDWVVGFLGMMPGAMMLGGELVKLVTMAMQGRQPDLESLDMEKLTRGGIVLFCGWLLVLIVQVVLMSTRGQSIGKMLLSIRVVKIADNAQAGFLNAWLLREAVMTIIGIVLAIIPFLGIIARPGFHLTDWLMILRDDRRCLHDLIAGTKVVNA
jgi:uncharacterized RDD family membrane protein YckC